MILYVTEALRWGDRESHSYVVGVYDTKEQAELAGNVEKTWRGGKYDYTVNEYLLNEIQPDMLKFHLDLMK